MTPAALSAFSRCWCLPKKARRGALIYLLCQWAMKSGCQWYVITTIEGPTLSLIYTPYSSFGAALVNSSVPRFYGFLWGSIAGFEGGIEDYVSIIFSESAWELTTQIGGDVVFFQSGYTSATNAANAVAGSGFVPSGFCLS